MEPFDCERLTSGFAVQPVNTLSSLVFVLGGFLLWRRGHRIAAVALGVAGIGSVFFHGSPSGASSWLHDVGLYACVAVAGAELWRRAASGRVPPAAPVLLAFGAIVWYLSRTGGALCNPESLLQGHAAWHVISTLAVVALFLAPRGPRETVPEA